MVLLHENKEENMKHYEIVLCAVFCMTGAHAQPTEEIHASLTTRGEKLLPSATITSEVKPDDMVSELAPYVLAYGRSSDSFSAYYLASQHFPAKQPHATSAWEPAKSQTDNLSLNLFGFSHHPRGRTSGDLREVNPGVGIKIGTETTFLGGHPYLETNFIMKNSKGGTTLSIGPGIEWTLHEKNMVRYLGGIIVSRLRYEDPEKHKVYWGNVPGVRFGIGWREHSIYLTRLPKDIMILYYSYNFW
jgi:hypothetical protein